MDIKGLMAPLCGSRGSARSDWTISNIDLPLSNDGEPDNGLYRDSEIGAADGEDATKIFFDGGSVVSMSVSLRGRFLDEFELHVQRASTDRRRRARRFWNQT